jgi:hypothetical protein
VDQKKLAALAKPIESTPVAPTSPSEPAKTAELAKANEKLSSLLGKKDE